MDPLIRRARAVWEELAGAAFPAPGAVRVAVALGPATLAYAAPHTFRPVAAAPLEQLPPDHPDIRRLERAAGPEDAAEAALDEITSPAFVIRREGEVAAAGYRTWPAATAHLSVLTSPRTRGLGLARTTASAATTHALTAALLPQWRARPPASRRVAAALGFTELGFQLSVELRRTTRVRRPDAR